MTKKWISVLLAMVTLFVIFSFSTPAYAVGADESGVTGSLKIITQPNDVCVPFGDYAATSVKAEGYGLQYQWFYKGPNSSAFIKTACAEETYRLKMNTFKHGCQVYCVVTDQFGSQVISDVVTMSVKTIVVKQPEPVMVYGGDKLTVTVDAVGVGLMYSWYYRDADMTSFEKSEDALDNTYTVKMNFARDGQQIYCVITDKFGNTVTTDTVTLSMNKSAHIVTQPVSVTVKEGETAVVKLQVKGYGLKYTWFQKNATASSFRKVDDFNGRVYAVEMNAENSGMEMYCQITDKYGSFVRSDIVTLSAEIPTVSSGISRMVTLAKAGICMLAFLILLYFALKKRDSKKLYNVIMVLFWIMIAMSMDSYDISNYWHAYDQGYLRGKEPLFDLLQNAFASAQIPFSTFKLMYGTVIWALLYKALKNFTMDVALAAVIFALGPMMGFGTQMRSTMAGVLMLNALPYLLKKDGEVWKYCAWIAFASLFHAMAAFYLVFLIPKFLRCDGEKFRNYLCVIAIVLIPVCVVFMTSISKILVVAQSILGMSEPNNILERLAQYFSGAMSPNTTGFLFATCAHIVVFFLTDRMCAAMLQLRKNGKGEESVLSNYAAEYLWKLNSILVLMIPCYILSMQFDRFLNYFLPVCYCLIVQGSREVLAFKKTEEGASFRIQQAGNNKLLRAVENGIWNIVDSKPVLVVLNGLQRVRLGKILQSGNIELLVLLVWMIFCFFVGNRFTADSEFMRIINGIGKFSIGLPVE